MTKIGGALPEPLLVVTSYHNQISTKPKRKHIRASWWWVCIYSSPNRIIPSSRRTEGGGFPADDPWPRVAVPDPVVCFRLRLHVVQRPPVHLLLFILSALMRRESLLDHWESLRIGWCVAQVSYITPLPPYDGWMYNFQRRDLTGKHMKTKYKNTQITHKPHTIWNWLQA